MTNATSVKDRLKRQAIEEKKTMQDKNIYSLREMNYICCHILPQQ